MNEYFTHILSEMYTLHNPGLRGLFLIQSPYNVPLCDDISHIRVCFLPVCHCDLQSEGPAWLQEQGERASRAELQRLRGQLERAQGTLHSQELELERLRILQEQLGESQREQQVSSTVGTCPGQERRP